MELDYYHSLLRYYVNFQKMAISSKEKYLWKSSALDTLIINILNFSIVFNIIGLILLFFSDSIDYYELIMKYNSFLGVFTLISHITMLSWLHKTAKISNVFDMSHKDFYE